jgi:RNA polymerase sigma factor (sigma-70 family)
MAMTLSRRHSQALGAQSRQDEFEALFQEHWERLCRVVYRISGDWDEAQDLVLDAFVQYYQHPPQPSGNPGGWLYRVATNLGLNALRARKRRWQYETQAGAELLENPFSPLGEPGAGLLADPAIVAEQRLERQQVRTVLSQMKPRSA